MALANVALTDIWDTLRIRVNQIIYRTEEIVSIANLGFNAANSGYNKANSANIIAVSAFAKANTAEANSLPLTGGNVTGNVVITGNVTVNGSFILNLL